MKITATADASKFLARQAGMENRLDGNEKQSDRIVLDAFNSISKKEEDLLLAADFELAQSESKNSQELNFSVLGAIA